jgi:polysaccharide export outer membrane protein
MHCFTLAAFALVFPVSLTAQAPYTAVPEPGPDTPSVFTRAVSEDSQRHSFGNRNPRYTLQAGDVFDVIFEFSPEYNQAVTVQPDGFVTLKGAGEEKVAGMSTPEVVAAVERAYSQILKNPVVNISLKEFEKPFFIADGMVSRPGKYPLRSDTTLMEAIAIAGGVNDSAKQTQVLVFRRASSQWMEAKALDLKRMLKNKDLSEDIVLQPGDMIYVPQTAMSKIRRYIPAPGVGMSVTPPL